MSKAKKKTAVKTKPISAEEFDRRFDDGESMDEHVDWDNASKSVLVSLPIWMVKALDVEAARLQVPRQAAIKTLLDEALKHRVTPSSEAVSALGREFLVQLRTLAEESEGSARGRSKRA